MALSIHINLPFPRINIDLTPRPVRPYRAPSMDEVRMGRGMLSRGMEGAAVTELQKRLGVKESGKFDMDTERAVRGFQKKAGITVDGTVGRQTMAHLDAKLPLTPPLFAPHKPLPVVLTPPAAPAAPAAPATLTPPPPAMGEIR